MTFRINFVQRGGDRWYCDLDCISDRNAALGLYTGPEGHGLFVAANEGNGQAILPEDEFRIPPESAKDAAKRKFSMALVALGWGPELDRYGSSVDWLAHRKS